MLNMSNLYVSGGVSINNFIRDTISMDLGDLTKSTTIEEVDLDVSALILTGVKCNGYESSITRALVRIELVNSTTVKATRYSNGVAIDVDFQVIEFERGIDNIQRGTISIANTEYSKEKSIAAVDLNKAILTELGRTTSDANLQNCFPSLRFVDSDTLKIERYYNAGVLEVEYQIIEMG